MIPASTLTTQFIYGRTVEYHIASLSSLVVLPHSKCSSSFLFFLFDSPAPLIFYFFFFSCRSFPLTIVFYPDLFFFFFFFFFFFGTFQTFQKLLFNLENF
eukprot:TRINITY_DN19031_c0_g1_i1.p1 TRINITY_DN19031_c0_g1~~TRINITY_DN19031_c0_g1_i1.p1  ORF type:complete len:100 (+),score=7.87 TRINITY_DN19031_c0_g1_i1:23-322(+)